jgi:hypothetical protein
MQKSMPLVAGKINIFIPEQFTLKKKIYFRSDLVRLNISTHLSAHIFP